MNGLYPKEQGPIRRALAAGLATLKSPIPWVMALLVGFGWMSMWSASWKSGAAGQGQYLNYYLRQLIWIGAGLVAFLTCALPHYLKLKRWAPWVYLGALGGLLAVFVLGSTINGSRRWIVLGPVQVQPSEFAKIAVVVALAAYLRYRKNLDSWMRLLPPILIAGIPILLILKEPDLGTCLLLVPVTAVLLFASGASMKHLGIAAVVGLVVAVVSPFFLLKEYQLKRVRAFVYQGSYSSQQKIGEAYQLIQSKIAVGSGGVTGQGWCKGSQNMLNFTPFRHTDFIFAVIGEEWGFLGATALMALYLLVFALSLSVAARTREPFGRLLVVGLTSLLALQVFINIGMTIGLAPITGLTLPFISYGGSSMVASFAALGLIVNVAIHPVRVVAGD